MLTTNNYGLKLLELTDLLSPKPLNENAKKVDELLKNLDETLSEHTDTLGDQDEMLSGHANALKTHAKAILGRVVMARGSYTGTGGRSVSIQTPGIKPVALLMKQVTTPSITGYSKVSKDKAVFDECSLCDYGFVLWTGKDIAVRYWYEDGTTYSVEEKESVTAYSAGLTKVVFTPANGSLAWTLDATPTSDISHGCLVNNSKNVTYEWIAFGYEEAS